MARRFFYIAAGMLMLALSFHFGFTTARAQAPSNPVVATFGGGSGGVVTANGDVYYNPGGFAGPTWIHQSNVFSGGPTPALHESWGQLKSRYHATPPATPGVTVTPGSSDR